MSNLRTVPEEEAGGQVAEQYASDQERLGYIANYTRAFSLRPEVYAAWMELLKAIRKNMRVRRYELVTIAAAGSIRCSY